LISTIITWTLEALDVRVGELFGGDDAFGLVADVDDHVVVVVADHEAGDDGARLEGVAAGVERGEEELLGVGAKAGLELGGEGHIIDGDDRFDIFGHGEVFRTWRNSHGGGRHKWVTAGMAWVHRS